MAAENLNGRQIRNQVRLLRVLHPDADKIPTAEIHDCMQYTQR